MHMLKYLVIVPLLLIAAVEATSAETALVPKYSSLDELRACLREEDSLKGQRDLLAGQIKDHSANLKRWQDETRAHVATQSRLDTSNEAAVDAFNQKIEALNARVDASNKEADRLNLDLGKLNSRVASANDRCAGMVVSSANYDAAHKERAESAKKR